MKPGVIITFDAECSMGGAWQDKSIKPVSPLKGMMGKFGRDFLGIPLICDILKKNDLKATFFLEPFNEELGYKGETEKVCNYLMENSQDIQLHIHPNHYHYGLYLQGQNFSFTDQMADLSPDEQVFLLKEGASRIEKWTGIRPHAFRAGNLGASEQTLSCLPEAGLWMDSSYCFPFAGGQCLFSPEKPYNGSRWYGDVLEVSLSGFRQSFLPGLKKGKVLDLMGISFEECRDAVSEVCSSGADAVVILHSFSLFKVKDKQYSRGKLNKIAVKRFEKFCRWLDNNREKFPVRTFAEFGDLVKYQGYKPQSVDPCLINNPARAFVRKSVQFANNFYRF